MGAPGAPYAQSGSAARGTPAKPWRPSEYTDVLLARAFQSGCNAFHRIPGDPAVEGGPGLAPRLLPRLVVIREIWLYLQNNGLWRSLVKGLAVYVAGRQRWYLTREDLTTYVGRPVRTDGYEFRRARATDLPRMTRFLERMPEAVLRRWCEAGYFFFVTWKDGEAVSYRCLSLHVHPGVRGYVKLGPRQLFMVDEFTAPAFRRQGITRDMAYAMNSWLLAHGFREVLGIHRTDNHDTIAATRSKGVARLGTITRWRVLNSTWFGFEAEPSIAVAASTDSLPSLPSLPPMPRLPSDVRNEDAPNGAR